MSKLAFTIGPVQGFIAQSRRTADGWAGSYLLSFLSAHAIKAVRAAGYTVEDPDHEKVALYQALCSAGSVSGDTTIASLPNNVIIDCAKGMETQAVAVAELAVSKQWNELAGQIFDNLPAAMRGDVQTIWDPQVAGHWELYGAWGDSSQAAFQALAARKGLRGFAASEEAGDRCTVCSEREVLWKYDPTSALRPRGVAQGQWRTWVQEMLDDLNCPRTLLRADGSERLCAICLVKRLLPWTDNAVRRVWNLGTRSASSQYFPSTSTMATVQWKADVVREAISNKQLRNTIDAYLHTVDSIGRLQKADRVDSFGVWTQADRDVRNGLPAWQPKARQFLQLDGEWHLYGEATFHDAGIDSDQHRTIANVYTDFRRAVRDAGVPEAPIYWALLTMDGDNMGSNKEAVATGASAAALVSTTLREFAESAPGVVAKLNGRAIFAGADDIVAFLPLETALAAADKLRCDFADRFSVHDSLAHLDWSLSASIIYAHHLAPLSAVLRRGQELLKQAKQAASAIGKNVAALDHYRRSGSCRTFIARWDHLRPRVDALRAHLNDRDVASGFAYALRQEEHLLGGNSPLSDADKHKYLTRLILKSRLTEREPDVAKRRAEAEELADFALTLACSDVRSGAFSTTPLEIVRWLAGGGREER